MREGRSTRGNIIYEHSVKEKIYNIGEDSKFVKVALESGVPMRSNTWYTVRIKYKPGTPVCRGTSVVSHPCVESVDFDFEKATFDGGDTENGSHELHGPLKDFYFIIEY